MNPFLYFCFFLFLIVLCLSDILCLNIQHLLWHEKLVYVCIFTGCSKYLPKQWKRPLQRSPIDKEPRIALNSCWQLQHKIPQRLLFLHHSLLLSFLQTETHEMIWDSCKLSYDVRYDANFCVLGKLRLENKNINDTINTKDFSTCETSAWYSDTWNHIWLDLQVKTTISTFLAFCTCGALLGSCFPVTEIANLRSALKDLFVRTSSRLGLKYIPY